MNKNGFLHDVLTGLAKPQKELLPKYFYDDTGSRLFDQICEQPEYYPTRTEMGIMEQHLNAITDQLGERCLLIEYGSGSSLKTRMLLDHLRNPAGYVPVEISGEYLQGVAAELQRDYPHLEVLPVAADFTKPFPVPKPSTPANRRVVYFPGSTIGNFSPGDRERLLRNIVEEAGPNGGLLMGMDLRKHTPTLEAAYNDRAGVTAAFNRNLLVRMNRELGADFQPEHFVHRAFFNHEHSRIEMHLFSTRPQEVNIHDRRFEFHEGESIRTEYSYKFEVNSFAEWTPSLGLKVERVWQDDQQHFSILYLSVLSK